MQKQLYFAILMLFLAGRLAATIVAAGNFTNGEPVTLPIVDQNSDLLTGDRGYVAVGSFSPDKDFSDLTMVLDGFRLFGTPQPFGATFETNGGIMNGRSFFEPSDQTGDLTNERKSIFVVIGKGESFATSTEIAVWRSDAVFFPDTEDGLEGRSAAFVRTGNGELLVGTPVTDVTVEIPAAPGGEVTYANGIGLVAIPEPSTGVLLALACLGLASHRRRSMAE
jgi:hypothetical protein